MTERRRDDEGAVSEATEELLSDPASPANDPDRRPPQTTDAEPSDDDAAT
ncbi:hypothetical protein [Sphingomonas sp. BK235]|nr:hypothetical protein [Sphingomonas sp. BK235]TCP34158.1 hypothetical protein EV292_104148 [Sphingomonas sp. BK235]